MKDINYRFSDRRNKLTFGGHLLHASTFSMLPLQILPARHYYPYFTDENTDTYRCEILPEIIAIAMADSTFKTLSIWLSILCSFYYDVLYPQELRVNQGIIFISISLPSAPTYMLHNMTYLINVFYLLNAMNRYWVSQALESQSKFSCIRTWETVMSKTEL